MKSEIAQLRTDLAIERTKLEEREKLIGFIIAQNERIPLLEAAAVERQRELDTARAEASEARLEADRSKLEAEAKAAAAREEWKSKGFWDRVFKR